MDKTIKRLVNVDVLKLKDSQLHHETYHIKKSKDVFDLKNEACTQFNIDGTSAFINLDGKLFYIAIKDRHVNLTALCGKSIDGIDLSCKRGIKVKTIKY